MGTPEAPPVAVAVEAGRKEGRSSEVVGRSTAANRAGHPEEVRRIGLEEERTTASAVGRIDAGPVERMTAGRGGRRTVEGSCLSPVVEDSSHLAVEESLGNETSCVAIVGEKFIWRCGVLSAEGC